MEEEDEIPTLIDDTFTSTSSTTKIPITIITGFLGSGKTTLLMHLLTSHHSLRIAVIINEYGSSESIDKSLSIEDGVVTNDWLELANGCFCCSLKDSNVKAIENLLKTRDFDQVVFECSGLADAGTIARMFWLDEALGSRLYLDGICCVVDAKYVLQYLGDEENECQRQIAVSDCILLNKCDLVNQLELEQIKAKLKSVNGVAVVKETVRSVCEVEFVLGLHSFDERGRDYFDGYDTVHAIEKKISTVVVTFDGVVDLERVDKLLQSLLWEHFIPSTNDTTADITKDTPSTTVTTNDSVQNVNILRLKAVLVVDEQKRIVQGVQELYDIRIGKPWSNEARLNKIVLIGSGLEYESLKKSFLQCLQ